MANNSLITLSLSIDGVELTEFGLEGSVQTSGGFGDPNVIGSTGGDDLFILRDEDITSKFENIGTGDTSTLAGLTGAANFDVVTGTDQDQTNNLIRIGKVLHYKKNQSVFGQGTTASPLGNPNLGGTWQITVDTKDLFYPLPEKGDYLFFAKNQDKDLGSIKGYFAEVEFVNDSTDEAELFSIGMEASVSSK